MTRKRFLDRAIFAALTCIVYLIARVYARPVQNSSQGSAQNQPRAANADDPEFAAFIYEVVSIKPHKDDPNARVSWMGAQDSPDGYAMRSAPMALLISQAYSTEHSKLAGAPEWVNNDLYDVDAKMEPEVADALQNLSPAGQKLARQHMLRVLARDYLKVAFHMETTQVSVYDLVIGKSGSKLKAPVDPDAPEQGMRVSGINGMLMWEGKNTRLESMMGQLSYVMGRPVYDKTGWTGKYEFTLKYTPDRASAGAGGDNAALQDEAPPITIAIEEQLGLKLVSGKGPMDMIVIDHVERPGAN